ncbi:MAG: iron-containing alcohol dehydrogenase [Woeseiaceae bacterium]
MTSRYYEFYCPVKILAGLKALEHLPAELAERGCAAPMVLTDKGVREAGLIKHVEIVFEEAGLSVGPVFDDIPPDSSTDVVETIARQFRARNCDSLIAVGGGSVMDTAKAVNILVSEGGEFLRAYVGAHKLTRPLKPLIAIATTAGTGSEVTTVAVIKDTHKQKKDAFQSTHLMPAVAVIDPRMTQTVPPVITAATAMDALTHAVEAFTCIAKNPLSDAYASAAIRKIVTALPLVLAKPGHADARLELAEAATMAGIAFSNSMVGLVHAIGHSLGAVCHLHHGTCMSLLLPYVLEYNFDAIQDDLGALLPFLAGDDIARATPQEERAKAAIAAIRDLRDDIFDATQLPRSLSESGKVEKSQFAKIADLSVDDGALMFNPVEADRSDVLSILERAWSLPDR